MTVETVRAAQAARVRTWRHRAGHTRSTLVDLAGLGRFLRGLDDDALARFAVEVGDGVARRALWAAAQSGPELVRPASD